MSACTYFAKEMGGCTYQHMWMIYFHWLTLLGKCIRGVFEHLSKSFVVEGRGEVAWALSTKIVRDANKGILKISQEEDINSTS